jgi:hypothetical protein
MKQQRLPEITFPSGYDENTTTSVDIPIAMVPIIAGLLAQLEWRASWKTEQDYEDGRQAAYLLQERLVT